MEIINDSTNLPWGALWHVRRGLAWISPKHLDGLSFIKLIDKMPEPIDKSPEDVKEAFAEGFSIYGLYHRRNKSTPPYITLNIKDIYRGVPSVYWWTSVPTILTTRTLAHEVAHHVIAKRGYINKPEEKRKHVELEEAFANRYASEVQKRMRDRWYYRLGEWALKDLAGTHYLLGVKDWNAGKYKEAAEHWYKAWSLDRDQSDAAAWYWRAKRMCSSDIK